MLARSVVTLMPVLGGRVAGLTATLSNTLLAGSTAEGTAMPSPNGLVESPPHACAGAELLRGMGPIVTKSAELLSVSMQPLPRRTAAVVLPRPAEAAVSEQLAVP